MPEVFWDPLRKKNVAATPEEKVRQWFIMVLTDTVRVPAPLMMSETGFKFGDKAFRADILIYDRKAQPLAVVECKRPDVALDINVAEQALKYNAVLSVRYIFLTNGISTRVFIREAGTFVPLSDLPLYEDMIRYGSDLERGWAAL